MHEQMEEDDAQDFVDIQVNKIKNIERNEKVYQVDESE